MGKIFYLGFISKHMNVYNDICLSRNIHFLSIYMVALSDHYGIIGLIRKYILNFTQNEENE